MRGCEWLCGEGVETPSKRRYGRNVYGKTIIPRVVRGIIVSSMNELCVSRMCYRVSSRMCWSRWHWHVVLFFPLGDNLCVVNWVLS